MTIDLEALRREVKASRSGDSVSRSTEWELAEDFDRAQANARRLAEERRRAEIAERLQQTSGFAERSRARVAARAEEREAVAAALQRRREAARAADEQRRKEEKAAAQAAERLALIQAQRATVDALPEAARWHQADTEDQKRFPRKKPKSPTILAFPIVESITVPKGLPPVRGLSRSLSRCTACGRPSETLLHTGGKSLCEACRP